MARKCCISSMPTYFQLKWGETAGELDIAKGKLGRFWSVAERCLGHWSTVPGGARCHRWYRGNERDPILPAESEAS